MFTATKQSHAATGILRLLSASRLSSRLNTTLRPTIPRLPLLSTSPPALRSFTSAQWRRRAATAEAEVEEEAEFLANESQTAGGVNQQPSSSNAITKFAELKDRELVCATVVDTLTKDMGLIDMTEVQSKTIKETLRGTDVIAQARTGTGKTIAFLLPVLQNIITRDPTLEGPRSRASSMDIRAIIISPTRELAEQIAVEARKIVKNTGVIVQTAVGGTRKAAGLYEIRNRGCHILVGTPGRLKDLLSDSYSGVSAPNLSAFVLDEADRLLDQGFAPEIAEIQGLLPNRRDVDRQTLLFSATVPREVMDVVRKTMKKDFKFVQTIAEGESQVHETVPQKMVVVRGFENLMPALYEICQREIQKPESRPFKAIVYYNATTEVILSDTIIRSLRNPGESRFAQHPLHPTRVYSIHGRLSQESRTRAADMFRKAGSAILLSSDVTARGMDFPNVTHVIQVGLPATREMYIHRVGRTARAGKQGEGLLLLTQWEAKEARHRLRNLPIAEDQSVETAAVDMTQDAQLPQFVASILTATTEAARMAPAAQKIAAYQASLGVYAWFPTKALLVQSMNNRVLYGWGSEKVPKLGAGLVQKLGYSGIPGIEIGRNPELDDGRDREQGGIGAQGRGGAYGGRGRDAYSSRGGGGYGDRGGSSRGDHGGSSRGDRGGSSRGDRGGSSFDRGGGSRDPERGRGGHGGRDGGFSGRERTGGGYAGRSEGGHGDRERERIPRERTGFGGGESRGADRWFGRGSEDKSRGRYSRSASSYQS